jgi:prenylcysteine oxidase / farnesylcysteine lyase
MDLFRRLLYALVLLLECVCILGVDTNGQTPLKPEDGTASRNVAVIGRLSYVLKALETCANTC